MATHNDLGIKGEAVAKRFLEDKGHRIVTTNFRYEHQEIDIISLLEDLLVFSEVKTRSSAHWSFPEEAVDAAKQLAIKRVATAFLMQHPEYQKTRFDVLSILIKHEKVMEIRHVEDAFY